MGEEKRSYLETYDEEADETIRIYYEDVMTDISGTGIDYAIKTLDGIKKKLKLCKKEQRRYRKNAKDNKQKR